MTEIITFRSLAAERGWKVTKNDKLVSHYPNQKTAERAMARQARAEAKKGGQVKAILHKKDGTIASERSYRRVNTPWLGRR